MIAADKITPPIGILKYRNRRGKEITIAISKHARQRFWVRWSYMNPESPLDYHQVDAKLAECFSRSTRLENLSRKMQLRCKRHGKDTLFFRTNGFTFIVQDATLLTVEISDNGKRHLNKATQPARLLPQTA